MSSGGDDGDSEGDVAVGGRLLFTMIAKEYKE